MKNDWVNVVENPDGSATLHIEVDSRLRETILRVYGKKRLTKKLVEDFVLKAIQKKFEMDHESR
jgi:hypothetical protein